MKNKKAISLIVLVITIIVMAILAATIIITLSNTNIIKQAQEAKDKSNEAAEKEALSVALAEWKIIETKGTKIFSEFMQEKYGADKVTVVDENKVTVTMESENKYNVAKDGTITKMASASKGAFVEYAVSYTDVLNSNNKYTTTNGWRLLDYTDNGDGTYSSVKLISTGVPAALDYYYNDTTNNSWYVTDETKLAEFKNVLGSDYTFYTGTDTYYGLQAAAGLYYNFKDIKFAYGASSRGRNLGYFTEIASNGTTYNSENTTETTGGNLFIPAGVNASVRLLTLPEMNKMLGRTDIDSMSTVIDSAEMKGIFVLKNIKALASMSSYNYDSEYCALSSPVPNTSNNDKLCVVHTSGYASSVNSGSYGLRPVIQFTSNIQFADTNDDGVLELVW